MQQTQHYFMPGTIAYAVNQLSKDEILQLLVSVPEIADCNPATLHKKLEQLHFALLTGLPIDVDEMQKVFTVYYGLLKLCRIA